MAIHLDTLRDEAPVIHQVTLTREEVLRAVSDRAGWKLGLTGSYEVVVHFVYACGSIEAARCELIPCGDLAGKPTFTVGAYPTIAEAAAGHGGKVATGSL